MARSVRSCASAAMSFHRLSPRAVRTPVQPLWDQGDDDDPRQKLPTLSLRAAPAYFLPGTTTSAFGTPHRPSSDSFSAGSLTASCVDGPPSRLRASTHPTPPFSDGSARKRAKAVVSAFVDTTKMTTPPSAHTAVRSAS